MHSVWYGHITFMLEELQHLGLCGTYTGYSLCIGTIYASLYGSAYGLECLAKAQRTLAYMHHIIILYSYIDWVRGQQQFFLPEDGPVQGSNKSAVVQEACL